MKTTENEKPIRTIRFRAADGKYVTCPVDKLPTNPILHQVLDNELLPRMKKIYDIIKDVLIEISQIKTLEQFEVSFMRDYDPEEALKNLEIIVESYQYASSCFKNGTIEDRSNIYIAIMRYAMEWFNEEEKERKDIKKIIEIYEKVKANYKKPNVE